MKGGRKEKIMKKVLKVMFNIVLDGTTLKEQKRQFKEAIEVLNESNLGGGISSTDGYSIHFMKILKKDAKWNKKI